METNLSSIHEDAGLITSLTQWVRIRRCCELWQRGCRCGSDPKLLWPWLWLEARSLIQPLPWELPYAAVTALKSKKKKKRKEKRKINFVSKPRNLSLLHVTPDVFVGSLFLLWCELGRETERTLSKCTASYWVIL